MKSEEQESNNSEGSNKSSTSNENDIKSRLRKNPNKTKNLYTDEQNPKKNKKNSDSYWKDICREIVEVLKEDERSDLFRHPAVNSFSTKEDKDLYKQRIKEPRDLGTILKKLKSDNYSPKEFCEDIELCWSNAISFNQVQTEAYQCALALRKVTNNLYKEKGMDDIIEKYNNEKENNKDKDSGEEKDPNTNDNTNNSNNNTNDSNNINDKLNLNESIGENNTNKDKNAKEDDKDSNMSNKSNKGDESYDESEVKKHKLTGKKRHRHKHKEDKKEKKHHHDKDNDEDKKEKKEKDKDKNNDKKRGRRRKKIDNDNIIKISKRKINFDDLIKKYPINFPVILAPEDINKMAIKKGKNKIKKMIKLNHTTKNKDKNHEKNHNNHDIVQPKPEVHKKRGRPPAVNIVENFEKPEINNKKIKYTFDWEFIKNNKFVSDNKKLEAQLNDEEEKYEPERRKIENEQMANYDTNCNEDNIPVKNNNKHKTNYQNSNINGIEIAQKKKKNDGNKNKGNNISNNISNINDNVVIKEVHINNNDNNTSTDNENKQQNNIEITANDLSVKEIQLLTNGNNSVKVVEKGIDKNLDLRIEIARYFDTLNDSNFIDLLVYIENIRPQSIRLLENDTIYIDMEAFNEETFKKVFTYIKSLA